MFPKIAQSNIFRWYRTAWGRYTQRDPTGLSAGVNLFAYVSENPQRFRDPLGLWEADPSRPAPTNTIVCRGQRIATQIQTLSPSDPSNCLLGCMQLHEQIHQDEANSSNPGACNGVPDGVGVRPSNWTEYYSSEIRAYEAEIECLRSRASGDRCCRSLAERRIEQQLLPGLSRLFTYQRRDLGY